MPTLGGATVSSVKWYNHVRNNICCAKRGLEVNLLVIYCTLVNIMLP